MARKIILAHFRAPGDVLMLTPLVRDLKRMLGHEVAVDVQTSFPDLWQHNPYLTALRPGDPGVEYVRLNYRPAMRRAHQGEPIHFLTSFYYALQERVGLSIPLLEAKPDLHLTPQERSDRLVQGRYWVLIAGGKTDMPTKWYPPWRWQEVVDAMRARGHTIVQCGAVGRVHVHPRLSNVVDLVGRTTIRQLLQVICHADGVICPITFAMHAAAALERPCVVVAGGREEPWWEAYVNDYGAFGDRAVPVRVPHRFLHTLGRLDCCKEVGCWRSAVLPREDARPCVLPVLDGRQAYAGCFDLIPPERILEAVDSYYQDGTLPPLEAPRLPQISYPAERLVAAPASPPSPAFTICVLLYGDYHELHRRCLESILQTVPTSELDLRVGLNAVCQETIAYLRRLPSSVLYRSDENRFKYPAMREMFHDPRHPLREYVVWFDDDSYVRQADWLSLLRLTVSIQEEPVGLYGIRMAHPLFGRQIDWFREAGWFRGRPLQTKEGREAPNGRWIHFVTGGWWCAAREAISKGDIPDSRLGNNGGDITIGEQVHQQGYALKQFNTNKALIHSSAAPRRGASHPFPWHLPPYTEAKHAPLPEVRAPDAGAPPGPRI